MASPKIVNRRPDEGDTDVSLSTPFRFGVRDADTRVDLSTIYGSATFARAVYRPDEDLPTADAVLAAAGAGLTLSVFNDASGAVNPGDPCDQTLEVVGADTVYRIEKSGVDDAPQEGMLYVTLPAQDPAQPYAAKVTLDLAFVTAASYSYTTHADFVGVVVGFIYWPENTGIFLLFRDDGTKRITVAGPAEDGIGTRPVSASVAYDWSSITTYTIYVDPTVYARKAQVYATDTAGEETFLAEVDLDTLNEFLPSVRMGSLYAENTPDSKVTLVFGLDGTDQGNYIDIYSFSLANYGRVLVHQGMQTGSSTVETLPSELIETIGAGGADEWSSQGTFLYETTSAALHITAATGPAAYSREEPDLATGEWLVIGRIAGENAVHEGTYFTGMGVRVEDGTRRIQLSLLDDFSGHTIGVDDADAAEDAVLTGYRLPADAVEWEDAFSFTLLGSLSRDALRLYVGDEDEVAAVDAAYTAAGYDASADTAATFGFTASGDYAGDFYLAHLWVFPNCTFYEPVDATYPEAQGWTRLNADGTRQLIADDLEIDCAVAGAYDVYYIDDATYDETSGAALIFKATVAAWTDAAGASSPVRSEFGPIALVRTSTVAAQVRFAVTDDGVAYVFLSNEDDDYLDVLAQNTAGQSISAEIDLDTAHVYLLDVKPRQYVRLYLDYATEPAIEVAWPASGALRELPAIVAPTAVVAWGSLDENSGVKCTFPWVRASIGKGYDMKVNLSVAGADLQSKVYGSLVDLLLDVQDED